MTKKLAQSEILQRISESETLIIQGAKQQVDSILNIGLGFKQMKDLADEVGWETLGYKNFGDYTEKRWGIKEQAAYHYVQVIENLPSKILYRVIKMSENGKKVPSFRRLLALPGEKSFWDNFTQAEFFDLASMSDSEFQEKKDGWQARYQKKYRQVQILEEEKKSLNAEIQVLQKQIDTLTHDLSIAMESEDNKKILKIQQEIENWKTKFNELHEKMSQYEAEEMTFQQARAAIDKAFADILLGILALKKIKLCLALVPEVYAYYIAVQKHIDGAITYICEHYDITSGPATLEEMDKEVTRIKSRQKEPTKSDDTGKEPSDAG